MVVHCLFCSGEFTVPSRVKIGDHITCTHCKTVFRVVWNIPLEIDWLEMQDDTNGKFSSGTTNSLESELDY
jgi:DNA-directed RNA polymerase subunit RPC12/RpoP